MRLPRILALALLLAVTSHLRADEGEALDIKTTSGKTYSHCQVVRVYPDGVAFRHSKGMAKVLFTDMTTEWRQHFGYDAAKVEAYDRKVSEDRAKAREVSAAKNAEVQKAWAQAYVQALQADALAESSQRSQTNYVGGYSFLDFGLGNQSPWLNHDGAYGHWHNGKAGCQIRGSTIVRPGIPYATTGTCGSTPALTSFRSGIVSSGARCAGGAR